MADYKIKDLETLSGIKAHTIRIWEKRYGLISPERTDTLIRTYNDDDLLTLMSIALLNKNGFKISKIAEMTPEDIAQKILQLKGDATVDSSVEKLILALIELDESLFKDTLDSFIESQGIENTFTKTLIPFLDKIGIFYLVGSINPAQEHFISNLIRQKIISEIDKLPIPKKNSHPVMLFLPEHEWHEISLLFYYFVLRKNGNHVIYLGQSLPYDSLIECIDKLNPKVLVTSWLTAIEEDFAFAYFKKLQKDTKGIQIFAGGFQINKNADVLHNYLTEITDLAILAKAVI